MGYPYTLTDTQYIAPLNGSYADVQAVQALTMSFMISNDMDRGNPRQIHEYLLWVSREIDAVLTKAGVSAPPPDNVAIQPILTQTAAMGAAALLAAARYETGDEVMGAHANQLMGAYDAMMGTLERGDINLVLMGCVSSGWAEQADRRKYYSSGNLEPLSDGTSKKPFITMQTQW